MPAKPSIWNIIINGAWNVAILTPDGVRRRLFELPDGTPVAIEVALDRPRPYRIRHENIVVVPSARSLEIAPQILDRASLDAARIIACRALDELPETPVYAAGVNIRYDLKPLPDGLINLLRSPIDDVFSDAGFAIVGGVTTRSLTIEPGQVNVEITQGNEGDGSLLMNFHRQSSSPPELGEWLSRATEFLDISQRLLEALNIQVQQEVEQ